MALFGWLYVVVFDLGTWGVWFGIATAVVTGLVLSLWVAARVARREMGGLFSPVRAVPAA